MAPVTNKAVATEGAEVPLSASTTDRPASFSSSNNTASQEKLNATTTPARDMSPTAWALVVISLLFSVVLFALDSSIVANVQPNIIEELGQVEKLPWISVGYAMGAFSVNLFVAKLFNSFDNKYLFIYGVVQFEIGSAVCGAAPNMTALIFGRVISGLACAPLYVGALNMLSYLTTEAERPMYLGFIGLTWGVGTILGPVIGGAFADGSAGWRWCFYINLCVGALCAPVYIFLLPSIAPRPGVSFIKRIASIDWLGGLLFAGAIVSLVMGINFGGSIYAWNSGEEISLFVVTGVLWILFGLQQTFTICTSREQRIVPVPCLRDWRMVILFAQMGCGMTVMFVTLYFVPLFFQFVQKESVIHTSIYLLPFVFLAVFGSVFNGFMMGKYGYFMPWYLIGAVLSLIGGSLFYSTVDAHTHPAVIYGYSILTGLGCGLFFQASFTVAQGRVTSPSQIPMTTAFVGCGQITGITLSLTISNTVFLNQATNRIAAILPNLPRIAVQQYVTGFDAQSLFDSISDSATQQAVLDAIVSSINNVYAMVIAAGAFSLVLSLLMDRVKVFEQVPIKFDDEEETPEKKKPAGDNMA